MAIKKPTKKEWIYMGAVAAIIFLLLLWRRTKSIIQTGSSSLPSPDATLTYNIPQPGGGSFTMPGFGNNYFGGANIGLGSGCNGCDGSPAYYGTSSNLASAMNGSPDMASYQDAINSALQNMPGYATAQIQSSLESGSIDQANYTALSNLPVLVLGTGTTTTQITDPAPIYTSNKFALA